MFSLWWSLFDFGASVKEGINQNSLLHGIDGKSKNKPNY
jgi:hypothetical protein